MLLVEPSRHRRLALAFLARAQSAYGQGRFTDALTDFEAVNRALPDHPDVLSGLALALARLERYTDAIPCLERLLQLRPDDAESRNNLALCLARLGRHEEALSAYTQALAYDSASPGVLFNLGLTLIALNRHEQAAGIFRQAAALKPDFSDALNNLGNLLILLWRHEEAADCFERLLACAPDYPYALGKLFYARQFCCDWRFFDEHVRRLRAGVAAGLPVITPFAYLMASESAWNERLNAAISSPRYVAGHERRNRTDPVAMPDQRIRIAYLSADFHDHATAYLMAGLFERHDRRRFEVTAFSYGPDEGRMRPRLKSSFDRFMDVQTLSDAAIAEEIRKLGIDIAVDLKGHTTHARTGILASRPAPVQVNFMGYPGTTALPFMDYIIADATVIPPGEHDAYSEQVVYLPDSYMVNDDRREIADIHFSRQEMQLPETGFVFCCFNNHGKLTPAMFAVWMRLLGHVPGSVLWLLAGNDVTRRNLQAEARKHGIAAERLVFAPVMPSPEHLARQRLGDLFLDTLPVNAHTTACDALWGGLPVLTCTGNTFAGRVATSLLLAAGLPELICQDPESYEKRALELALSPEKLAAIRRAWQSRRPQSRLFDTARYSRHLEAAYEEMHQRRLRGLPPEGFQVAPINR